MVRSTWMILAVLAALAAADAAHANGYATDDSGRLYRVYAERRSFERLGTVKVTTKRGETTTTITPVLTDLALSDVHGLYGISFSELFKINLRDPEKSTRVGPLSGTLSQCNALAFHPDGRLFALGSDTLYGVNRKTGAAKAIGRVGSGGYSDGDLAFVNGVLYGTFARGDGSHLVRIDLETGKGAEVGLIHLAPKAATPEKPKGGGKDAPKPAVVKGIHAVWGLIFDGHKTWALTQDGNVLSIDLDTARATHSFRAPLTFWGACAMLRL